MVLPEQMVPAEAEAVTVGVAVIVIVCVDGLLEPKPLVATRLAVYVPAAEYVTTGF